MYRTDIDHAVVDGRPFNGVQSVKLPMHSNGPQTDPEA